jgi:hypothetical protein
MIEAGVGDLVRKIEDDQAQVGYSVAGQSGGAVCDPHRTRGGDEKCGLLGLASKPVATICQWLASKPLRRFLGLDLKTKVDDGGRSPAQAAA